MTLCGATFFAAALAPASREPSGLLRRLAPPLALLSLLSGLAWLVFVARAMADGDFDFETLNETLWETAFGRIWQARLVILVALLISAWRPGRRWRAAAFVSGLAVASLGLVGHAAMQTGALGFAHRLNHALHLLLASYWLGGLPPFLLCLRTFARGDPAALEPMRRFSRIGHFAVAGLFLSGALDIAMIPGAVPWPLDRPYRVGLFAKILVFAAMSGLALVNRYVLAPKIARHAFAVRALAASACAEVALALTAISLVSAFATFDPH